jgi:hypothetical protein
MITTVMAMATTTTIETTRRHHMPYKNPKALGLSALAAALALAWAPPSEARVTKVVIDRIQPLANQTAGETPYETITGRAFGELDPTDEHNTLITDIDLAPKNANGKADYVASFFVVKPVDMGKSSGLLWHDVPNRGGRITISSDLRTQGDVGVSSGWQGDNAGATAVPANASSATPVTPTGNEWVKTPVVNVTGQIFGRIVNRSGPECGAAQRDGQSDSLLPGERGRQQRRDAEGAPEGNGERHRHRGGNHPERDWKFCGGGTFAAPLPVTTLPVQVCMRNGFDGAKLYQLTYTVKDPYVLGAGTAGVPRRGLVLQVRQCRRAQAIRWGTRPGASRRSPAGSTRRSSAARRSPAISPAISSSSG